MQLPTLPRVRVGIGQDSHRFLSPDSTKPCTIAGLIFEDAPGLLADSDGDVVFHSICNAITSVSGVPILGGLANDLCLKDGITDSQVYLEKALESLGAQRIEHIALSIEGKRPDIRKRIDEMRARIAKIMKIRIDQVGLTAISGDGLTDFGCGDGLQCKCIITTVES
ncbi:MAG: 2-C-methyl-D-erythritol 2,4-cyclodiphosphate synthase [Verrucomicrobia bacterium]|nr:2-C-methyl-D-erythritol 2,4-cyclodiphosphate synthase [Verrucomicrobiota bacterium]